MDFKKLKLLTELIDQYEWQMGHGLAVWIEYSNCTTVFDKILEIDTERFPNCLAERTGYLDKFLVDCNGNSVHTGDILTNNVTGESFKVVNRFQQKVIHYLGNPRVVVAKLNKKGEAGKKEFSIFTCELKECFSIKNNNMPLKSKNFSIYHVLENHLNEILNDFNLNYVYDSFIIDIDPCGKGKIRFTEFFLIEVKKEAGKYEILCGIVPFKVDFPETLDDKSIIKLQNEIASFIIKEDININRNSMSTNINEPILVGFSVDKSSLYDIFTLKYKRGYTMNFDLNPNQ